MKPYPLTLVDGQLCNTLPVLNRGLAFGDGVFETMLVRDGRITLWQYHYQRLVSGLQRLSIDVREKALTAHIDATLQQVAHYLLECDRPFLSELGTLKLIVTRGYKEGERGYAPSADSPATLISIFTPFKNDAFQQNATYIAHGVDVHCCEQKLPINPMLAGIKSLNQLSYVLASHERALLSAQEGLLFDVNGSLIEATARNIFIVKNGEVFTPPLQECGVAGVMRRLIIDNLLPALGMSVIEIKLSKKNLLLADEVFLSNSIGGIWPVVRCEDKTWLVGDITQQLQLAAEHFLSNDTSLSK